jgi:predicted SprT family Zn-dependent metalloprotease
VKSHDLSDEDAESITYQETENRFVIVLDPNWNTSEEEALHTMQHEACHVATWEAMDPNDVHGPPFQECMKRFAEKE